MASDVEQQSNLRGRPNHLRLLVSALLPSVPVAPEDGPIAHHFGDFSVDEDEGPYYNVDKAWVHTFQVPEEQLAGLVSRGNYGLQLVYDFFAHFAELLNMEANDGLILLTQRVDTLIALITRVSGMQFTSDNKCSLIWPNGPDDSHRSCHPFWTKGPGYAASDTGTARFNNTREVRAKAEADKSRSTLDKVAEQIMNVPAAKGKKTKDKPSKKQLSKVKKGQPLAKKAHTSKDAKSDVSEGENSPSDPSDIEEIQGKPGRPAQKQKWAFSHYTPIAQTKKEKPIWKWECNWCKYGSSPNYTIPGGDTVQQDLDILCETLDQRLNAIIKENESKLAIASDLWTSKNSVYAFAGVVGFWIDENWNLIEQVLELTPLDGDHSGSTTGRLIYKALRKRKAAEKLITSSADNASSNGTINCTLSTKINEGHGTDLKAEDVQVGCAGHVTHLVVQCILHSLGLASDPDVEDLYEDARQFPLTYDPSQDPVVQEEMKVAEQELSLEQSGKLLAVDELQDSAESTESEEGDSDAGECGSDVGAEQRAGKASETGRKSKKHLSAIDKIPLTPQLHAVVVDILHSEVYRKRMQRLIRQLCNPKNKHLVPIRVRDTDNLHDPPSLQIHGGPSQELACKGAHQAQLRQALKNGLEKLEVHMNKALVSKYPLLGAAIRLKYFEQEDLWDPKIPTHARQEFEALYKKYAATTTASDNGAPSVAPTTSKPNAAQSVFASAIGVVPAANTASELDMYFNDLYPCTDEDGALP
ncbi:hypothetical protein SCP_1701950 [Sparassis crispa]|uniref:Uncharacterized protein n=1 Tax=Sparassis crispa TaxID=139825 RepID=A0A401H656_9APHY|nr:hypothetical protein SCP_1701950 [Sparassis crispa]GBE89869.1 hypothetical protein SCP_1701950 [Sparassis crispa]